ncbi:hypothetical protein JCGZ_12722 [Jatropha curcas]|uniref:G-patch domain-containing protein n=1 Tax=Jatropha curcas TaxID=180498 RepID=A0A067KLT0_JATCU|nr:hypothetical protein JCGZ_12722 [Jatropha curcas]
MIGSGLPEEVVLVEAEWEERICAMLNIWDECSSDEEEKMPVKIEIEKSITVKVAVINAPTTKSKSAVNRMSPFSRKMMKKMNWQYGKGLGRELQGMFETLSSALGQQDKCGLGYSENRKKESRREGGSYPGGRRRCRCR